MFLTIVFRSRLSRNNPARLVKFQHQFPRGPSLAACSSLRHDTMATDEAQAFYDAAYSVVRLIPRGQVTTYGTLHPSHTSNIRPRRKTNQPTSALTTSRTGTEIPTGRDCTMAASRKSQGNYITKRRAWCGGSTEDTVVGGGCCC
jgi:alkylated DNA nucleotide flippase Atl1